MTAETTKRVFIPQNAEAVEAKHPGYTAVAGPYGVNLKDPEMRKHERALCARTCRAQQKACPHARIVFQGAKAWIIRKKPLELDEGKNHKAMRAGSFGIKAGRGTGSN